MGSGNCTPRSPSPRLPSAASDGEPDTGGKRVARMCLRSRSTLDSVSCSAEMDSSDANSNCSAMSTLSEPTDAVVRLGSGASRTDDTLLRGPAFMLLLFGTMAGVRAVSSTTTAPATACLSFPVLPLLSRRRCCGFLFRSSCKCSPRMSGDECAALRGPCNAGRRVLESCDAAVAGGDAVFATSDDGVARGDRPATASFSSSEP